MATLAEQITAAQAKVTQALFQLDLDQVTADLDPTPANLAAVKALQDRVNTDEAALAKLYAQQPKPAPTTTTTFLEPSPTGAYGGELGKIPTIPILGVVEGTAAAAAAGAWGTFLDETAGLVEINTSLETIAAGALADGGGGLIAVIGGGIVASIAELPEIVVAAGMLIIVYLVGKILIFVGKHFPNPNILGWHPLNFIRGGIQDVGQALVDVADLVIHPIVALIMTPIHLIRAAFQRAQNAISSAHNKIAELFHTTIPQARHDAVVTSEAYTDLSVSQLTTLIENRVANAEQRITDLQASLPALILSGNAAAFAAMDAQLLKQLQGDETMIAALATEIQTQLPLEIATAVSDAQATENQQLTSTANNLQNNINGLQGQLTTAQSQIATVVANITTLQTQLAALGPATPANTAEITALQTQITTAEDDYNNLVVTIDDLENQITGISTTLGNVQTAQQLTTSQINGVSALGVTGLVAVVGVMATAINAIRTEIDTCLVDNCDQTKPNNIHNVLKDILAGILATGEIAYVAQAIADPVNFANSQAPAMEGIDSEAVSLLNSILGL